MKKICVVTGTRAEYGLLRLLMDGIRQSSVMELQLVVTGAHLSPEFGLTVDAIESDGFYIDHKVEMLLSSDTSVGITKSMGLAFIGFADAFERLKPDLMLLLGDRYEIFSAAAAASIAGIPIAHIHGGETTEGAVDEAFRHSITKMSHFHFVAAEEYKRRVIQLGENPDNVFNVGGLGVDSIIYTDLLEMKHLEESLNFKFFKRNLLITFHPITLERNSGLEQMDELLAALGELEDTGLIFTMSNADTNGRIFYQKIEEFCKLNKRARVFKSLGQLRYLSCIKYVDGVIGNSSSGLTEVPSFRKGTINIGDRQRGRLKASSVIDCEPNQQDISEALDLLFSEGFQVSLNKGENPYGNGGASQAIVSLLEKHSFESLLKKHFYNSPTK
jgi:GDP/UDP-N,N'-diacetylbacillosamine 2-epimerase (hydrolysing)